MPKHSAGILLYRFIDKKLEVFLVHPGGPFWAKKDKAAWSIPKGEFDDSEDPLEAAKREFKEETGIQIKGPFLDLGQLHQPSRKIVHAWAMEGHCEPETLVSNEFEMEWPPKSGKYKKFPEVDRASWFTTDVAREKVHKGQVGFIDRLCEKLSTPQEPSDQDKSNPEKFSQMELFR